MVIGLWILAGMQFIYGHYIKENQDADIVEAFSSFGLKNQESLIESIGTYDQEYLELSQRKPYVISIANQLGITSDYEIESIYEVPRSEVKLIKNARQAITTIQFVTMEHEMTDGTIKTDQYVIIKIQIQEDLNSAMKYKDLVDQWMQTDTKDHNTTINLKGSYKGKIDLDARNELSDKLLATMNGIVVSEHRDMELYTIYGYTDRIKEYKETKGGRVNLNIAMNYDEGQDKTFLYFASPVVGFDY